MNKICYLCKKGEKGTRLFSIPIVEEGRIYIIKPNPSRGHMTICWKCWVELCEELTNIIREKLPLEDEFE